MRAEVATLLKNCSFHQSGFCESAFDSLRPQSRTRGTRPRGVRLHETRFSTKADLQNGVLGDLIRLATHRLDLAADGACAQKQKSCFVKFCMPMAGLAPYSRPGFVHAHRRQAGNRESNQVFRLRRMLRLCRLVLD